MQKKVWSKKNGTNRGNSIITESVIESTEWPTLLQPTSSVVDSSVGLVEKKLSWFLMVLCLLCYYYHQFLLVIMLVFSNCFFSKNKWAAELPERGCLYGSKHPLMTLQDGLDISSQQPSCPLCGQFVFCVIDATLAFAEATFCFPMVFPAG